MKPSSLRESIARAAQTLAGAGVASPDVDARLLAAHLLGVPPMQVMFADVPADFDEAYAKCVARRAAREPLQHIIGTAPFYGFDLAVGPGVFIPRPETEVLAEWAVRVLSDDTTPHQPPTVVDLGSGTGALAITIACECPHAQVIAVERSSEARKYLETNVGNYASSIRIVPGDMTDPELLRELDGTVDLVVTNPPYVPETDDLDAEVYVDPHEAVFSGDDGMDAISGLVPVAARLLRPGGHLGIEHDDSTSAAVQEVVRSSGAFGSPSVVNDLTGRARFVTASKLTR